MPHTLAIIPRAQILGWDNMTACGPVAAQANLLQVKPRPPRRPKPMCPNRLKAIQPSLAQRGTALRASHEAVLRGRTSGFASTSSWPIENAAHIGNRSTRHILEGGIVTGSPYGDPVIPRMHAEGPPYGRPTKQCFVVEPVGSHPHPRGQLKMPHEAAFSIGGEGGIRTHVTDFVRPSDFESAPLWPLRYLSELESCRSVIF